MRLIFRFAALMTSLLISTYPIPAQTTNLAINAPDQFNWELFVTINALAANGKDRVWETWADNATTFPKKPSLSQPPKFPSPTVVAARTLQPIQQLQFLQAELKALGKPVTMHPLVAAGGGEEVRRNQAAFDFIIAKKLWYKEGIAEAFAKGETLSFPPGAIEVKAAWGPADFMTDAELKR